jgi:hypothetical protein
VAIVYAQLLKIGIVRLRIEKPASRILAFYFAGFQPNRRTQAASLQYCAMLQEGSACVETRHVAAVGFVEAARFLGGQLSSRPRLNPQRYLKVHTKFSYTSKRN